MWNFSRFTIVSWVSAHGYLNITHDFGLHGRLPGIKILYTCIEVATVAPWNAVHGRLYTREWAIARDTMVISHCLLRKIFVDYTYVSISDNRKFFTSFNCGLFMIIKSCGYWLVTPVHILYFTNQLSSGKDKIIGSGSQVLNSVILQVTKAVSLYNDRDRWPSLTFPRQLTWPAK